MVKTFFIGVIILVSISGVCSGQRLPIGINPMEYNSSFAGMAEHARLNINLGYAGKINTINFNAAYDQFLSSIGSGVGVSMFAQGNSSNENITYTDNSGNRMTQTVKFRSFESLARISFAPKISIKGKYTISPSIDIGYYKSSFSYDYGITDNQDVQIKSKSINSRFGILFNSQDYYVGVSTPVFSWAQRHNNDSLTYDKKEHFIDKIRDGFYALVQAGYTFQKNDDSNFSFTPQLVGLINLADHYNIAFSWPSYNLGFRYKNYLVAAISDFDLAYPNGYQLGWQNESLRLLFSNDFNFYSYTIYVSMRYIFQPRDVTN